ncbi:glycosyltransferase family 2 protein [Frigoriglobus tundricola]|uniref:GT2 family glycosyltransferase n=1 Tax=Frigoriglobus tundricola TaxID=2774151 RepID=A0A6M5Z312_9BACT|nr:glycosyltransferase family 2 protein [Frigoriglobus tundricola]QJX00476.1 GT2 family glycosyltransferase [Frigoriglobus tundricola]
MRLSVALCTYNGAAHLRAQLDSIAGQTRPPDELVVRDDRSSDATPAVLGAFAAAAPFPVRIAVNEVNLGSTRNFEGAIAACSGDVIFLCDQDDVWHPQKLARFEAAFRSAPGVGLVASDLEVVGPDLAPTGLRMWESLPFGPELQAEVEAGRGCRLLLRYNVVTGAAAAFRADLRDIVLPIPNCWVHDGWIAFLTAAIAPVRLVREPLTNYRQHSEQQIGTKPLSLSRQIAFARRRDAAYFDRLAEGFEAAAVRLAGIKDRLYDPLLIELTLRRAAHARVQQHMRTGSRVARVGPSVRELVRGNYHRFGHGLKAFAADLLL